MGPPFGRPPVLRGPRIVLRPAEEADIDAVVAIGRHPDAVRGYGIIIAERRPIDRRDAEETIRASQANRLAWTIDAGGYIGSIRFHSVVWPDRRASMAIGIADPERLGRGLGPEAMNLALGYAFREGFHRISVRVLASNQRAIAAYLKCGFVEERRERQSAHVAGGWQDDLVMGLLSQEFGGRSGA